jgi:hypothetical protein
MFPRTCSYSEPRRKSRVGHHVERTASRLAIDFAQAPTLVLILALSACDAAKEDLKQCLALEATDPEAALSACQLATEKSATSDSGKRAADKISSLKEAVAELTVKRERARIAEQEARADAEARLASVRLERIDSAASTKMAMVFGFDSPMHDLLLRQRAACETQGLVSYECLPSLDKPLCDDLARSRGCGSAEMSVYCCSQ